MADRLPPPDERWVDHALDVAYRHGLIGGDGRLTRTGLLVAPVLAEAADQLARRLAHRGLLPADVAVTYTELWPAMPAARYYDHPCRAQAAADLLAPDNTEDTPR